MPEKPTKSDRRDDGGVELETQFILRMPEGHGAVLRDAIRSGANLKERLSISLENDLRKGMVMIDGQCLYAKVVDLPTIIEAMKTIDKKSFYKTADICQMVMCKEEPHPVTDDESPQKNKKKDPNKVDKKYLYPHGVTPSLKNVRKRRFRKTLKKKNVELPEIEKEVKRLLRVDCEAVNVKWEIVECEEAPEPEKDGGRDTPKGKKGGASTSKGKASKAANPTIPVDEHHIFGEEVSDSEDEDVNVTVRELDIDDTRMSEDSRSRFSDSNSMMQGMSQSASRMMTEFNSNMFEAGPSRGSQNIDDESIDFTDSKDHDLNNSTRIAELRNQLSELRNSQTQIENELKTIINNKLRERYQEDLEALMSSIIEKEMELDELMSAPQM